MNRLINERGKKQLNMQGTNHQKDQTSKQLKEWMKERIKERVLKLIEEWMLKRIKPKAATLEGEACSHWCRKLLLRLLNTHVLKPIMYQRILYLFGDFFPRFFQAIDSWTGKSCDDGKKAVEVVHTSTDICNSCPFFNCRWTQWGWLFWQNIWSYQATCLKRRTIDINHWSARFLGADFLLNSIWSTVNSQSISKLLVVRLWKHRECFQTLSHISLYMECFTKSFEAEITPDKGKRRLLS